MSHRFIAAITASAIVLLGPAQVRGQAFWEDAEKLPMAPSWLAEKAGLPPYTAPRTSDGVPDLQGHWSCVTCRCPSPRKVRRG